MTTLLVAVKEVDPDVGAGHVSLWLLSEGSCLNEELGCFHGKRRQLHKQLVKYQTNLEGSP